MKPEPKEKPGYSWKIVWTDTGDIQERPGYKFPHSALMGAKRFIKDAIQSGEHSWDSELTLQVVGGRWDKPETYGNVVREISGYVPQVVRGIRKL